MFCDSPENAFMLTTSPTTGTPCLAPNRMAGRHADHLVVTLEALEYVQSTYCISVRELRIFTAIVWHGAPLSTRVALPSLISNGFLDLVHSDTRQCVSATSIEILPQFDLNARR
jgi:hypothetical protein